MSLEFLSEDWIAEAERARGEIDGGVSLADVQLNILATGGPSGDREAHIDGGALGAGLLDNARATLTVPFDIARALLVEGDQQKAMQAFTSGKIKVQGDMSSIMSLQMSMAGTEQQEWQRRLQEITAG